MKPAIRIVIALVVACVGPMAPAHALVNGEAPAEDDTRFDAVGAFSHSRWLGLVPDDPNARDHNWYGNATLIAPDVVILAKHLIKGNAEPPAGEYAVRFRRHIDGTIGTKKDGADSFHNVKIVQFVLASKADLALGILEKPVEHIEPMTVGFADFVLAKDKVILGAWGSESRFRGVGGPRNQLMLGATVGARAAGASAVGFPAGDVETRDWREDKETGKMLMRPYVTSEYPVVNLYDSGGAVLTMDDEGKLQLVGIIVTYGGAVWVSTFDDPKAFPIKSATEAGAKALEGFPFRAQTQ